MIEPARCRPQPRLGLCCQFHAEPVRFRTTTATVARRLDKEARLAKLDELTAHNARSLRAAVETCGRLGIRAFRIGSGLWPLYTHPELAYRFEELPGGDQTRAAMRATGELARELGIRLSFHPDQFTVLSTPREETLAASVRDLEYAAEMAELVGADVVNIHAGGVYGDRRGALERLARAIDALPDHVRTLLTLENDDVSYTPADLLPLCRAAGIPLVYDVHHHRCNPDGLAIEEATMLALETWNREPLMHISSPRNRAPGANPRPHADLIDPADVPDCWRELSVTIDVEAKAKEIAVAALQTVFDSHAR